MYSIYTDVFGPNCTGLLKPGDGPANTAHRRYRISRIPMLQKSISDLL